METKISIHIETGDADLAERIGRALNGNLTERYEGTPSATVTHSSSPEEIYGDGPNYPDGPEFEGAADRAGESHPQTANRAETAAETENARHAEGGTAGAHTAGHQEAAPGAADQAANSSSAPRDQKGVPFHTQFCGQAKEPFYASGKRSGQWKKKKGVTDEQYDGWYAEELAKLGGNDTAAAEFNTGAAFGAGTQARQQEQPAAPQDTGGFMGWLSEKQAAGLITQDDIQQAYAAEGVQITDLFPPNDPHTIASRIRGLYDRLAAKAGA